MGCLTATVTATRSTQGLSELAQRLPLLLQRRVRIDRHRYLDCRMTDDLPNHVRRHPEIEQERHAGVAEIVKPDPGQACCSADHRPTAAQVVWLHRGAAPGGKHEPVVFPVRP